MEKFGEIITSISNFLWGAPLLVLLVGTHIFMTIRTGFIQRKLGLGIKLSIANDKGSVGDVSQFAALATALASTIGTGNIVGVGTAIALGGPGAVIWMWLCGVFGIATKYAECLISVKYRVKDDKGMIVGGAMFALERGLNMKWLAVLFALFTAIAAFGIGSMVQSNAMANMLYETWGIKTWISGLVIAVAAAAVILGGIKQIARASEALVPSTALIYIIGCIVLLCINGRFIPEALKLICVSAFNPSAASGGAAGFVMVKMMTAARYGVSRGLFSNESGMGSAPIVAAAAQTRNSVRQALVSCTATFWDTVVMNLITSLMIICTALANPGMLDMSHGGNLVRTAFTQFPVIGNFLLIFGLLTFAFTTIFGWCYYGEKGFEYLCGTKYLLGYRLAYCFAAFLGAVISLHHVWNIADILNALMILPNIVAMLLLSGVIARETKKYLKYGSINDTDMEMVPFRDEINKDQ